MAISTDFSIRATPQKKYPGRGEGDILRAVPVKKAGEGRSVDFLTHPIPYIAFFL